MTPVELAQIERAVREEIRTAALLDTPPDFRGPPPYDLDAERAVIAAAYAGHRSTVRLATADFWVPLHGATYAVLVGCLLRGIRPRPELVAQGVDRLGYRGREVAEQVATLLDASPICLPLDDYAARVLRLARVRRTRVELERMIAMSGDVEADVEDLARRLRAAADALTAPMAATNTRAA